MRILLKLLLALFLMLPSAALATTQNTDLQQARAQWEKLSPEERQVLKKRLATFKKLPKSERNRILKRHRRFKA